MPRAQRKKNPVSFLAGGSLPRAIQKDPQVPPKESNAVEAIKSRMLAFRVDTILHPTVPKWNCDHGIRIAEDEIRFQSQWKRKYHTPKEPPISFECIRCYPICVHGLGLTPKEINSGKRFSGTCPKCVGKFTNVASLAAYLEKQQLSINQGMSLNEGEHRTSYGYLIPKSGNNFVQAGGSKETEQIDAAQFSSGPVGSSGHGSDDDYDFDGVKTDDLGDPVSLVPSETTKAFEQARTESTKEALDIISYEIIPAENNSGWIILGNGIEISRHDSHKSAKKAIKELTEFDRLNFENARSKGATNLEHKEEDLLSEIEIPEIEFEDEESEHDAD